MRNPLRWRICCPDCGWIPEDRFLAEQFELGTKPFDCGRCGAHYSADDFALEMDAKHQAQHHNHAKADLSQEEQA